MNAHSATPAVPATGYLRQSQLVGRPARKRCQAVIGILPFSSATLWRMVKRGDFPAPVKLSEKVTAWKAEDIRAWIASREQSHGAAN